MALTPKNNFSRKIYKEFPEVIGHLGVCNDTVVRMATNLRRDGGGGGGVLLISNNDVTGGLHCIFANEIT